MKYLELLIIEAKRLEAIHENDITELEQELLDDISKEIEANQLLNQLLKQCTSFITKANEMNPEDLKAVITEVESSYTAVEMAKFETFGEFFAAIDVQNGYEEDWNPKKWRKYYKEVWEMYKNGKLTNVK